MSPSPHELCESGEDSDWISSSVGAAGIWGEETLLRAMQSLDAQSRSCVKTLRSGSLLDLLAV